MRMILLIGLVTWSVSNCNAGFSWNFFKASKNEIREWPDNDQFFNFFTTIVNGSDSDVDAVHSVPMAAITTMSPIIDDKSMDDDEMKYWLELFGLPLNRDAAEREVQILTEQLKEDKLTVTSEVFKYDDSSTRNSAKSKEDHVKAMNEWFRKVSTSGNLWQDYNIGSLIRASKSPSTNYVIATAVSFNGAWAVPFDLIFSFRYQFRLGNGKTVLLPIMRKRSLYKYGELKELNAKFVGIPLGTNNSLNPATMWIICPNEWKDIRRLKTKHREIRVERLQKGISRNVEITMPKFSIKTSIEYDLDFDGSIYYERNSGPRDVHYVHRTYLDIHTRGIGRKTTRKEDENSDDDVPKVGTLDALVTRIRSFILPTKHFIVDRPFAIVISSEDGRPLFQGFIVEPKSQ